MTGVERAIEALGGQQALADACGVTQPAVSRWKAQGWVPAKHWHAIEVATGMRAREIAHPELRQMIVGS